jgi:hypothetical protein
MKYGQSTPRGEELNNRLSVQSAFDREPQGLHSDFPNQDCVRGSVFNFFSLGNGVKKANHNFAYKRMR